MPCVAIVEDGKVVGIARVANARRRRCQDCKKRWSVAQCDFVLPNKKTCDRRICQYCSDHVKDSDIDYCRSHWRDQ